MRTIEIEITDTLTGKQSVSEIGTNDNDGGLFVRRADGTWGQMAGNSQTPIFKTAGQMMRYLRTNHYSMETIKKVRGSGSF